MSCIKERTNIALTRSDVSDQPPFDAFARLGLRIVQPPQVLSE